MKRFSADLIFSVNAEPIKDGIVTIDDTGKILAVGSNTGTNDYPGIPVERLEGAICPGFINTHCHLELSHLHGKIARDRGLVNFIKDVQANRSIDTEDILSASRQADDEMSHNGIVAVGDIANSGHTIAIKQKSKAYYHTFIEVFGFIPQQAEEVFNKALDLCEKHEHMPCSVTPHAPYSVSKELFKLIRQHADSQPNIISIHNQESEEENKFYRYKLGEFVDLYRHFKTDISFFKPQARNSLQTIIPLLTEKQEILLVHNTFTNLKDIYFIKRFDRKINWCFCPNANLYIEGRLPKVEFFLDKGFNITLGTDSLASNDKLCILNEMRTVQKYFPAIGFKQLLQWGTLNGAKLLGIDKQKGSIEVGKRPGLNLITNLNNGTTITAATKVRRLI